MLFTDFINRILIKLHIFCLLIFLSTISLSLANKECAEPGDVCNEETEYNAYLDCLKDYKRQKRSAGCYNSDMSCEYVACNECQGCSQTDDCSNNCRRCCTESCNSQLCCHKTCNNQCKTNYCRSGCRRQCKENLETSESGNSAIHSSSVLNSQSDTKTLNKHNITTIINLHNIINNTNQIDIPIKINNTNYNNITLMNEDQDEINYSGGFQPSRIETDKDGNRCCQVVGPRVCQKVDTYPYMKCFHYRKHRCGPYCNAPVVHAQPQQVCEENACHNRMIYIPQPQPRCFHTPYWPYTNCGGGQMSNCHGCYKHYTQKSHIPHGGCSRCYDDGIGMGSYLRQGPIYRPGYAHAPSCIQMGACGYPQMMPPMMPFGGYGMGMGYGMDMGYGGYGMDMGYSQMGGYPFTGYEGALGGYPVNNLGYPPYTYNPMFNDMNLGQNITVTSLDSGINPASAIDFSVEPSKGRNSRYASIVIDGPKKDNEKTEKNEEKKESPKVVDKKQNKDSDKKPKKDVKIDVTTVATSVKTG